MTVVTPSGTRPRVLATCLRTRRGALRTAAKKLQVPESLVLSNAARVRAAHP